MGEFDHILDDTATFDITHDAEWLAADDAACLAADDAACLAADDAAWLAEDDAAWLAEDDAAWLAEELSSRPFHEQANMPQPEAAELKLEQTDTPNWPARAPEPQPPLTPLSLDEPPAPKEMERRRRAHGGSVSPAGHRKVSWGPNWAKNRAINYFTNVNHPSVRCRVCKKVGAKKVAGKASFHCIRCSVMADNDIVCLKQLLAVCKQCKETHEATCKPGAKAKTCIEAGCSPSATCNLCELHMAQTGAAQMPF